MTKNVFSYRNGVLCAEAMPLAEIAEEVDTPFYCMSNKQLKRNARVVTSSVSCLAPYVHYAVRVNASLAVLRVMAESGVGAEVVSVGELERAIDSGMQPNKIIMAGSGKTRDDIAAALLANVSMLYASSLSELTLINEVAACLGKTAPVALAVSFDGTENTSSFSLGQMVEALNCLLCADSCALKGFAGRCLTQKACENVVKIITLFRNAGFAVGFLGLCGHSTLPNDTECENSFESYVTMLRTYLIPLGCVLAMQFGRTLVRDAGALVAQVLHVKREGSLWSLSVDAGLNDCTESSFYELNNEIIPVREDSCCERRSTAVLGRHGGQVNSFGSHVLPATVKSGDFIAVMNAGAYGSVMASTFGGRSLIPEIMVSAVQYAVIRRRLAVTEQMGWETYPEWLEKENCVA